MKRNMELQYDSIQNNSISIRIEPKSIKTQSELMKPLVHRKSKEQFFNNERNHKQYNSIQNKVMGGIAHYL